MSTKPREPRADEAAQEDAGQPQKPSIEVEREQAGVAQERPAPAPPETLLPPD